MVASSLPNLARRAPSRNFCSYHMFATWKVLPSISMFEVSIRPGTKLSPSVESLEATST